MGKIYGQLDLKERIEIYHWHANGKSVRAIGVLLGRAASTISRELRRNSRKTKVWSGGYQADRAHTLAQRRRRQDGRFKLLRQPDLQVLVKDRLAMGWSPEQIAGRLAKDEGRTVISYESIYRFIYHRSAQKDYWHRLLPRRKSRRGTLGKRGGSPASYIQQRQGIQERPTHILTRQEPGHWEADLMLFSTYGQILLALHERKSRFTMLTQQATKSAADTLWAMKTLLEPLPQPLRQTLTFDNGTEFALHYRLKEQLNINTFFCDVRSPGQKGGIENAIGRMRRFLPRKTNLQKLCPNTLKQYADQYNATPRKCLGFKTPTEIFSQFLQPLHFNRESTSQPSLGRRKEGMLCRRVKIAAKRVRNDKSTSRHVRL